MIPRSASEVARAIGAELVAGDPATEVRGVSIDSRTTQGGDVFFAIRGPRHDGHAYVRDAAQAGATVAVVDADLPIPEGLAIARVGDTTAALGALATDERRRRELIVVAVTGSSGKTTTRELCRVALSRRYRVDASPGNFNNQWGLPLSLLGLSPDAEVAVLELGMNRPGEIEALTRLCEPDVGLITNAGRAHLGFFASVEEIAAAKAELLTAMPGGSPAVLPAENELLLAHGARSGRRVLTFGFADHARLRADDVGGDLVSGARFRLRGHEVALSLWGRHAVLNALAALGVAEALGLPPIEAAPALRSVKPLSGRGALLALDGGLLVIDESYNSNPNAMLAVLEALAETRPAGRRVAVLGDMLELGDQATACHEEIGRAAAASGLALLCAVGEHGASVAKGARDAGVPLEIETFPSAEEASRVLPSLVSDGDLILVKGSRGVGLERAVEALEAARPRAVNS